MLRAGLVSLVVAASLALAGFAVAARPTPAAQYRAQATAVCTSFASRIAALGDPSKISKRKQTQLLQDRYALHTQRYAALRALKTPASLKDARAAVWYTYYELGAEGKVVALASQGKAAGALNLLYAQDTVAMTKAWKAAGIAACAKST
jgi:hypothetical protein